MRVKVSATAYRVGRRRETHSNLDSIDLPPTAFEQVVISRHRCLLDYRHYKSQCVVAAAMMRARFSSDMKSDNGIAPVIAERKAFVAS